MIFKDEQEIFDYIKRHQRPSVEFIKARDQHKELVALVIGDDFIDELIQIEHLESNEKASTRKKFSRDIQDFFERLLNPISNVFSATGGSKKYDVKNEKDLARLLKKIANIRGGKSIESFVETKWMPLYHVDPNGIIFMEYKGEDLANLKPTYKSIGHIRFYEHRGQLLDNLLFEPVKTKEGQLWRVVDDENEYKVLQVGKETFTIIDQFPHPFGEVPGLIISDIIKINEDIRLSPIHKIVALSREYARDQSIKTLLKFLHGFPIFWKYIAVCKDCHGVGKTGEKRCKGCEGKGFYTRKDVTDTVTLPIPTKEQPKLAPDIAGFISPDLESWGKYDEELQYLERLSEQTHWGTHRSKEANNETATARFLDVQPMDNRLDKYSSVSEFVEWKITEWTANFVIPSKKKDEPVSFIAYGRRYIMEPPDIILDRYEKSRLAGDNATILDRLLNEYITAKYRTDPAWLRLELLKIEVEPHIHYTAEQIQVIFGNVEAQKKIMFDKWWKSLDAKDFQETAEVLQKQYITWFDQQKIDKNEDTASSSERVPIA